MAAMNGGNTCERQDAGVSPYFRNVDRKYSFEKFLGITAHDLYVKLNIMTFCSDSRKMRLILKYPESCHYRSPINQRD